MAGKMVGSLMIIAVTATSLLLAAAPAMADPPPNSDSSGQDNSSQQQRGNPNLLNNPYAIPFTGQGGGCVLTYNAPPAEGLPPAGSNAAGGNPGWIFTGTHGNNC